MQHARVFGVLLLLLVLLGAQDRSAEAGGSVLDGRAAPDMSFTDGLNGGAGASLSSFKGRAVLLIFWLRDCPHCRRELPRVQELHDKWGKAGLQVLTVVHKFPSAEVAPVMRELRYDFPVGIDSDGAEAKKYGVSARPATYLIGIDGRVKSSNGAPNDLIATELGRYRLAKLGKVPASLKDVRDAVWQGRMASALRDVEEAAKAAGAGEDLKELAQRVREIARETMDARATWASKLAAAGRREEAAGEFASIREAFAGTSLESDAARLGN